MKTYNFASFFFSRNFLLNDLNLKYVYSYTNNNNEHASNREKFEWGGLVMLVKTEGTLSFVHACLWPKKTWPHDAQEIVRHMMACFGLYFQVIIFDQFLLLFALTCSSQLYLRILKVIWILRLSMESLRFRNDMI